MSRVLLVVGLLTLGFAALAQSNVTDFRQAKLNAAPRLSPAEPVQDYSRSGGRVIWGKWRSERELGRIGGTFGGIVGGFGGLVGILGGLIGTLSGMGKARAFVMGTMKLLIGLGILLLIAGLVLVVTGQWWVFYVPLFFMGLLLLAIMVPLLPVVRMRYDQLELRRISAQDAGR